MFSLRLPAGAFLGALAFYVPSLSSDVWFGDRAEFQTVPYILGIAHPTGFPAYTLAGWLFTHAAVFGTVAWRMNLLAALCVALTSAGIVVLAELLECNGLAALFAALAFACGSVVWVAGVLANPHAAAALMVVVALGFAVAFAQSGDRRALIGACAATGVGLAIHPLAVFVLPGIAVAAAWQWRSLRPRTVAFALSVLLAPLLFYAYLPVRSAAVSAAGLDPAALAPIHGAVSIDWDTNHPRTLDGFLDETLGRSARPESSARKAFSSDRLVPAMQFWFAALRQQFGVWMLLPLVAGFVAFLQRGRRALVVFVFATAGAVLFALQYRNDSEIEGYVLVPYAVMAVVAAASSRLSVPRVPPAVMTAGMSFVLAAIAVATWFQPHGARYVGYPTGQAVIDDVRANVPDGAIVVAQWEDAQALGYGAFVERVLGSRTIVAAWPDEFASSYRAWTRSRRLVIVADARASGRLRALPVAWLRRLPNASPAYIFFEVIPAP